MAGGYTAVMVTRRLAPLLVAVAIAFAPVALDACQVMCAVHTGETTSAPTADAGPPAHSCHHLAESHPAADSTQIQGGPHRCGHGDDLPAAAAIALQASLAAPAILPDVPLIGAPARNTNGRIEPSRLAPPPRIANIAQLRV